MDRDEGSGEGDLYIVEPFSGTFAISKSSMPNVYCSSSSIGKSATCSVMSVLAEVF